MDSSTYLPHGRLDEPADASLHVGIGHGLIRRGDPTLMHVHTGAELV